MKYLIFMFFSATIAALSGTAYAETKSENSTGSSAFCQELEDSFKGFEMMLPLQVDQMTTITKMAVDKHNNSCVVNFSYLFKESEMIKAFVEGGGNKLTNDQAIEWIKSDQGRDFLKQSLTQQSKALFTQMDLIKDGVTYQMTYSSDGDNFKPMIVSF